MDSCREWPCAFPDVPGREELPPWFEPDEGGRWELPRVGGIVNPFASCKVMMRRPGLTVEVGAASPALVEVAVRSDLSVLETRVDVDDVAVLSSEFCVIVEVDAERELVDDVPRWVSLSSGEEAGQHHARKSPAQRVRWSSQREGRDHNV